MHPQPRAVRSTRPAWARPRNSRPTQLILTCRKYAAFPIIAVALISLNACGDLPRDAAVPEPPGPAAFSRPAPPNLASLPEINTFNTLPDAPLDSGIDDGSTGTVLHPTRDVPVYESPGGRVIARLPTTQAGSPTWVPVVRRQGQFRQVLLPTRPNGSTGWVSTTEDPFDEAWTPYRIDVDTARFVLTLSENGNQTGEWTIGTGKPQFPTPHGRTFVLASIEEANPTFSPIILPLGFHSESHETFAGGPGTVALHGWPDNSPFGKAMSDGCIRVPDDALRVLSTLPLGTIVTIR